MPTRRSNLILVGLILLALAGVAFMAVPGSPWHHPVKKGLDLQGGLEVVLKAVPPKGHKLTSSDLDRSVSIMRNRVDKLGVSEPIITKQGANQISIQLAGVHNVNQAASIIGSTAQLELYDLEPAVIGPSASQRGPVATRGMYALLSKVPSSLNTGTPSGYVLFKPVKVGKKTVFTHADGPIPTLHRDKTTGNAGLLDSHGGKVPKGWKVLPVPKNAVLISCSAQTTSVCPGEATSTGLPPAGVTDYYLFKHGPYPGDRYGPYPNMKGTDLNLSGTRADIDPTQGPVVLMQFTGHGNKLFHQVTKNEAIRGSIAQSPQHFAIVLDNEIKSWPQIDYKNLPNGIDPTGTGAQITGLQSFKEAQDLALVLQTGALPVSFQAIERTDVSATLGKDSLNQARDAAIGGLIAVIIFLLVMYRFLGVVAVIGLGVYAAFMYGAIMLLGVTLTLPGFAGLILTIGVAADANVVIFERIKEESRAGKSVRAAIAAGYQKGFALMLLIGTVVSLITAVAATRAMLGLLAGFKWFEDPRFMGATGTEIPRWQRIDVVGRRRLWFILSLCAVGLSVLAIAIQGLNLGIDFKGGVQVGFTTPRATSLSQVRHVVTEPGAVVQGRGTAVGDSYKSFQVRLKKLSEAQQTRLTDELQTQLGAEQLGVKNVSASFSRQIVRSAIYAIIVSFALIALYVTLRYRWRFAVPILRTLLNDIPIVLGIYAISGREVTASTVAAILTILGYSVYDTIIVFDRIRENIRLMPRASIATIANVSVWEVLRRSIVTSVITLLPIVALFIFGGATLKDFAFAIIVGISVGAVSTIFIATPLLASLMERDPEYARRKKAEDAQGVDVVAEAERSLAAAPAAPTAAAVAAPAPVPVSNGDDAAKRDRRRQRRKSRPHGRAR